MIAYLFILLLGPAAFGGFALIELLQLGPVACALREEVQGSNLASSTAFGLGGALIVFGLLLLFVDLNHPAMGFFVCLGCGLLEVGGYWELPKRWGAKLRDGGFQSILGGPRWTWLSITSYEWTGWDACTLILHRQAIDAPEQVTFLVPAEHKATVEHYLTSRVPWGTEPGRLR